MRFFLDVLLPRLVYLPYFCSRVLLTFLHWVSFWRFRCWHGRPARLCLEAGVRGWDLIEYKEVIASAQEYLGGEHIGKVVIDRSSSYVPQVHAALRQFAPTHYVYDSRTGGDHWLIGLWQAFQIAVLFQWYGVVPICVLTDLPVRKWRAQTAVVSARRGVVVSLMLPRDVQSIFPHSRLIGPQLMAFSRATLAKLRVIDDELQGRFVQPSLVFTGSLYEPRTSILRQVKEGLQDHGIELQLRGRELGSQRFTDDDYWRGLASATMVITTANLCQQAGIDWPWVSHLIYRYLEVPATGSVLVAQPVPGLERYLQPDVHYIAYTSPAEAVEKIAYYWTRPDELRQIALAGRERMRSLVESGIYWLAIDVALKQDSMI